MAICPKSAGWVEEVVEGGIGGGFAGSCEARVVERRREGEGGSVALLCFMPESGLEGGSHLEDWVELVCSMGGRD